MLENFSFGDMNFWKFLYKLVKKEDADVSDNSEKQPIFVLIMLACFGDILICNSCVQNIRRLYPKSKIVFIVNKPWEDVAKYQKDADEVYVYDKRGVHKGFGGLIKFVREFPYKNIDYLLRFHPTERTRILSRLLKSKRLVPVYINSEVKMQENMANILKNITDEEIINYPITYCYNGELPERFKYIFSDNKKCIALCTTSKLPEKDMPIETAVDLINKLNKENYKVLYIGAGQIAQEYAQKLINSNCDFINLVNETTITDLACILKLCDALVSVDTGTMHFGYSLSVPTIAIFYKKDTISLWAPSEKLYNVRVISEDFSVQNIYNGVETLLQ